MFCGTFSEGTIVDNTIQPAYGRNSQPGRGACYGTYYITDEEPTDILERYTKAAKGKEFKGP